MYERAGGADVRKGDVKWTVGQKQAHSPFREEKQVALRLSVR